MLCLDPMPCITGATCVNGAGNYTCICPTGFEGDGKTACTNIDECALSSQGRKRRQTNPDAATCDPTAICIDTEGSYTCVCPAGTILDGNTQQCLGKINFSKYPFYQKF